jgi:sodium-dependent phosphate cotransporter
MRSLTATRVQTYLSRSLDSGAWVGLLVGVIITVMVQSSSITTSLLVPLAAAGLITIQQAFPVTVGANIGTTVTALLASLAVSGPNASAGVHIALAHLLFNVSGTLLVVPFPAMRRLPLAAAERIATVAVRSKQWALFYILFLFYALPGLLAVVHRMLSE